MAWVRPQAKHLEIFLRIISPLWMEKDESRYHNLREWQIIHVAQINKNTKLLNIKCTVASIGFISAIWTTFFRVVSLAQFVKTLDAAVLGAVAALVRASMAWVRPRQKHLEIFLRIISPLWMEKDESRYHNLREWKIIHVAQINKQFRPRSDAAERGVWSGSTRFSLSSDISTKKIIIKKTN